MVPYFGTIWDMIVKDAQYWANRCAEIVETYDGDPEAAHGAEDDLLQAFVMAISEEAIPNVKAAADQIYGGLLLIPRVRWYA